MENDGGRSLLCTLYTVQVYMGGRKMEEEEYIEPGDRRQGEKNTKNCFRPGSNRRPFACQADVITATLRKLLNIE